MTIDKDALIGGLTGSVVSASGACISVNEVGMLINIIVAVLGALITLTTSVIIPLIQWRKNAKKDGKVDDEELKQLGELIKQSGKTIEQVAKELKEKIGNE